MNFSLRESAAWAVKAALKCAAGIVYLTFLNSPALAENESPADAREEISNIPLYEEALPADEFKAEKSTLEPIRPEEVSPEGGGASLVSNIPVEEEEITVFDIYLGDVFKGGILTKYTESWFEVENYQDVVDQIQPLRKSEGLEKLLSGVIRKSRLIPGVGSVRFDPYNFRIVLSLDPSYLPVQSFDLTRRLPDPENKFSFQQQLGASGSGILDNTDIQSASLTHRTLMSVGKYLSKIDGTALRDSGGASYYILTEASAGGIIGSYRASAGLLESGGLSFGRSIPLAGLEFETANELFLDQDLAKGSRLQIFVPSHARVEFYRGGRLLSVQVLDFGLQDVDTSGFPPGSYDVDVIITEDNGTVTRDQRYFVKSGYLVSRAMPVFMLQAGWLRDEADVFTDQPVYQAGIRWRAAADWELSGNVTGSKEVTLGEVGATTLWRGIALSGAFSFSSAGQTGANAGISGPLPLGFMFYGSLFQTLSGFKDIDRGSALSQAPRDNPRIYNMLDYYRSTASLGITKTIGRVDLRYSLNRNIYDKPPPARPFEASIFPTPEPAGSRVDNTTHGPQVDWRIMQGQGRSLTLRAGYLHTDQGKRFDTGLYWYQQLNPHYALLSNPRTTQGRDTAQDLLTTTLRYDDRTQYGFGQRIELSNELNNQREPAGDFLVADQLAVQHGNRYLEANAFVRDVRLSGNDQTAVGANLYSSFLVSHDGAVSVAYPAKEGAVMIVEVASTSSKSEFELLLNDQVYEKVRAGQRLALGVGPYREYNVKIRPTEGADIVDYDTTAYNVTMFPGNIVSKKWSVEKVFVAIGRILDEQGRPISLQRIKGTRGYAVTEEDGTFQAEITGREPLYIDSARYHCTIQLNLAPDFEPGYFMDFGDLVCKS